MVSLNEINEYYNWITNSSVYRKMLENSEDLDEQKIYPVCTTHERNMKTLINVIKFWQIEHLDVNIYYKLSDISENEIVYDLIDFGNDLETFLIIKKLQFFFVNKFEDSFFYECSKRGYLDMVKWFVLRLNKNELSEKFLEYAIENKQKEITEFLIDNNCPISDYSSALAYKHINFEFAKKIYSYNQNLKSLFLIYAIWREDYPVVAWLIDNDVPVIEDHFSKAYEVEKFDIIKKLHFVEKFDEKLQDKFAEKGNYDAFIWAIDNGYDDITEVTLENALISRNIKILEYLMTTDIEREDFMTTLAVENLEVLKFLYENGFECNEDTFSEASNYDNIEVLK